MELLEDQECRARKAAQLRVLSEQTVVEPADVLGERSLPRARQHEVQRHQRDARQLDLAVPEIWEDFGAELPVCDGEWMLVSRAGAGREASAQPQERIVCERLEKHRPPCRRQDASELCKCPGDVQVVQDCAADDEVERVIRKSRRMSVSGAEINLLVVSALAGCSPSLRDLGVGNVDPGDMSGAGLNESPSPTRRSTTV